MHSSLVAGRLVPMLRDRGESLAVVAPDGTRHCYRDLGDRVSETAAQLGAERRLVLIDADDDVDTLVTYLAALHGGHPVLMTGGRAGVDELTRRYDPDVTAFRDGGSWVVDERRPRSVHALHPELALLLSTSGSTGSPKLVRLSGANIAANAAAIGGYLDIRETDRAALSLPMHYCYGLSVVHSNLLRGAALLLPGRSVTDPAFFEMFREHGGTSLHGVPHTFELLDRLGFDRLHLPHLRYLTQAGGRLAPQVVRRYAELGARRGWRMFVMYGQTEATARMAYLPPEQAATSPSTIGVPIPGGSFEIESPDAAGVGELVYRGPNVMLGYAHGPADLATGRGVDSLPTGDLARRRPDGLYEIVGRRNRTIKRFGLRIDLEQVERLLADDGVTAAATGSDDGLVVVVTRACDPEPVARQVARRIGLPPASVRALGVDTLPRRPNGKVDHEAVAALAAQAPPPRRGATVRDTFATVLALPDPPDEATFVELGGDSLSYVQMSVELQRVLGHLPARWDTTPIAELERLPRRRRRWASMETGVVLRAVAIVLVVGTHVDLFDVTGGAHLLLGVTGWAFARFVLAARRDASVTRAILHSLAWIAVPTMAWIGWRSVTEDDVEAANALLLNQYLDPEAMGYWYVESVTQVLLLLAALFAVPAVRRLERAHPFGFAVAFLPVALVGRVFPEPGNPFSDRLMSTHLVLWLFVLGWVAHRAATPAQRMTTGALILLLVPDFFAHPPQATLVTVGLVVLLLVPRIAVPRTLVRPVGAVAAASLAIYLTHYAVYPALLPYLSPLPVVVACIAVGIATAALCRVGWRAGAPFLPRSPHPSPGRDRDCVEAARAGAVPLRIPSAG